MPRFLVAATTLCAIVQSAALLSDASLSVALYQGGGVPGSTEQNLQILARVVQEAGARGADLVVFPELFLSGYNIGADALKALAEPATGLSFQAISGVARAAAVAVLYGYPEAAEGATYNSAQLVLANGSSALNYRKTHLWGAMEHAAFVPGDRLGPIAEVRGVKVGVLVCYDAEFPENHRVLALAGAQFIAIPTSNPAGFSFVQRFYIQAAALQNNVHIAYTNRVGDERGLVFGGESLLAAPNGTALIHLNSSETDILALAPVSPWQFPAPSDSNYLMDRRPALYDRLCTGSLCPGYS